MALDSPFLTNAGKAMEITFPGFSYRMPGEILELILTQLAS